MADSMSPRAKNIAVGVVLVGVFLEILQLGYYAADTLLFPSIKGSLTIEAAQKPDTVIMLTSCRRVSEAERLHVPARYTDALLFLDDQQNGAEVWMGLDSAEAMIPVIGGHRVADDGTCQMDHSTLVRSELVISSRGGIRNVVASSWKGTIDANCVFAKSKVRLQAVVHACR